MENNIKKAVLDLYHTGVTTAEIANSLKLEIDDVLDIIKNDHMRGVSEEEFFQKQKEDNEFFGQQTESEG